MLGANGFLGTRIAAALEVAGYRVMRGVRPAMDLARDLDPSAWGGRLQGIDVVVNAAGILRGERGASLDDAHFRGPAALFAACASRGVKVIQVSALGADAQAQTAFHRSKRAGDEALLALPVPSLVVQPSLVFGSGGASATLFATLASLPGVLLPGDGTQRIQPVHVDDVADAIVAAIERGHYPRSRVAAVGPRATSLRDFLGTLRAAMGLGPARFLGVPVRLVGLAARLRLGLLDRDTWSMLQRGNVADAAPFRALLGRDPRAPESFVAPGEGEALRREALLGWLLPLLRYSVALVWIVTGVVSAGLYPVDSSLELLRPLGLAGAWGYAALYLASALDLAIGIATLAMRRRRRLWALQLAVIAGYTVIITLFLPGQWLHPFGPVLKNLPLLAAILLLHQMERR